MDVRARDGGDDVDRIRDLLDGTGSNLVQAALLAALEALGAAACLIDDGGNLLVGNQAAHRERARCPEAFRARLRQALDDASASTFRLQPVGIGYYLALSLGDVCGHSAAIERAAREWKLTPKQKRVLGLLAEGLTNKGIATRLRCAESTVEYHVTGVLAKASAANRAELISSLWRSS